MGSPQRARRIGGGSLSDVFRDPGLRVVNGLLAGTILTIAVVIILRRWPELFPGAADVGTAAFDLSLGYVAGWIFFYLTVWRPREIERHRIQPDLVRNALAVWGAAAGYLGHAFHSAQRQPPNGPASADDVQAMFGNLQVSTPTNLIDLNGNELSIGQAARDALSRTERATARVQRWAPFVPIELQKLLFQVVDSPFLTLASQGFLDYMSGTFSGLSSMVVNWLEDADRLRAWIATNMQEALSEAGLAVSEHPLLESKVS